MASRIMHVEDLKIEKVGTLPSVASLCVAFVDGHCGVIEDDKRRSTLLMESDHMRVNSIANKTLCFDLLYGQMGADWHKLFFVLGRAGNKRAIPDGLRVWQEEREGMPTCL